MTKDEALKLALEALEGADMIDCDMRDAITAIKEALAQPEQEPVATLWQHGETGRTRITMPNDITDCDARWFKAADLYTTPPLCTWVGLTQEELSEIYNRTEWDTVNGWEYEQAIEAKLKEKNCG